MGFLLNAREYRGRRRYGKWKSLLTDADPGFVLTQVIEPQDSGVDLICDGIILGRVDGESCVRGTYLKLGEYSQLGGVWELYLCLTSGDSCGARADNTCLVRFLRFVLCCAILVNLTSDSTHERDR